MRSLRNAGNARLRPLLLAVILLGPLPAREAHARSPRTGDLATIPGVGLDAAPGEDAWGNGAQGSVSQEFYWSGANAIRGTLGLLSLPARAGGAAERASVSHLSAGVSHNWLRGSVFPYVVGTVGVYRVEEGERDAFEAGLYGAAGMEVRLGEAITFRLEMGVHALTGPPPDTVVAGSVGVSFYY